MYTNSLRSAATSYFSSPRYNRTGWLTGCKASSYLLTYLQHFPTFPTLDSGKRFINGSPGPLKCTQQSSLRWTETAWFPSRFLGRVNKRLSESITKSFCRRTVLLEVKSQWKVNAFSIRSESAGQDTAEAESHLIALIVINKLAPTSASVCLSQHNSASKRWPLPQPRLGWDCTCVM